VRFLEGRIAGGRTKPRTDGLTMVLDRWAQDPGELTGALAPYVDVVKIGWGIPVLVEEESLRRRVQRYRESGISVSHGGTLLEMAVAKGRHVELLERLLDMGFDTLELSEGVIDIPSRIQREIVGFARTHSLRLHWEVGRKSSHNQLSLEETVERIDRAKEHRPDLLIIEGRESGRSVEIYDDTGAIKWDWVDRLIAEAPPLPIMFEAPREIQQTEMVLRLGPHVNLGNVAMGSVAALETQRQGLRGDSFGVTTPLPEGRLSPAGRFLFHLLRSYGPMDQGRLMALTGLSRRTVQYALRTLVRGDWVRELPDPHDYRRRLYNCGAAIGPPSGVARPSPTRRRSLTRRRE
jgi:phosphosulfolactate synthase